jgi:hypothetical protein
MTDNSFVGVLRNQIRTDMNNYADDLASGACQNFDQYQKLCGVIQGLAIAERYLLDLAEKMEKQNDE